MQKALWGTKNQKSTSGLRELTHLLQPLLPRILKVGHSEPCRNQHSPLASSPPPSSPRQNRGRGTVGPARHCRTRHLAVLGWEGRVAGAFAGASGSWQSILGSPFSCSAISCLFQHRTLHLLLLNHFLFTACLLQPPSSMAAASNADRACDGQTHRHSARSGKAWPFPSGSSIKPRARDHWQPPWVRWGLGWEDVCWLAEADIGPC